MVLLVERSAYFIDLCTEEHQTSKRTIKGKQKAQPLPVNVPEDGGENRSYQQAAAVKKYAEEHGVSRGGRSQEDDIPTATT